MHTPAPWHREGLMVYDADNQLVAIIASRSKPGEAEENGNLITLAPKMFEGLQTVISKMEADTA